MQHYNHMISPVNIQQSNISVSGSLSGTEHAVRTLPGRTGIGVTDGMNKNMPICRPPFQGSTSSSVLSPSSLVGIPNPVNLHSGPLSAQGNSCLRHHEALHLVREISNNFFG